MIQTQQFVCTSAQVPTLCWICLEGALPERGELITPCPCSRVSERYCHRKVSAGLTVQMQPRSCKVQDRLPWHNAFLPVRSALQDGSYRMLGPGEGQLLQPCTTRVCGSVLILSLTSLLMQA
jgi:hypothetical protein